MSVILNGNTFTTWDDVEQELFTPEEIAESNLRAALIGEIIKARQEHGITQEKLAELSGIRQSIIARMEKGCLTPQLSTVLKVLAAMGKTLAIVPISRENKPETHENAEKQNACFRGTAPAACAQRCRNHGN